MKDREKKIYQDFYDLFYKYLDYSEVYEILQRTETVFSAKSNYWSKEDFFNQQHDMFVEDLMKIYCHADEELQVAKEIPQNMRVLYRGVEMPKKAYLKNLKNKVYSFHRNGNYGKGNYLAIFREMAEEYTRDKKDVLEVGLADDIKMVKSMQVVDWIYDFINELNKDKSQYDPIVVKLIEHDMKEPYMLSVFAGAHEIDAITDIDHEIVCAINPSKVLYKDEGILGK